MASHCVAEKAKPIASIKANGTKSAPPNNVVDESRPFLLFETVGGGQGGGCHPDRKSGQGGSQGGSHEISDRKVMGVVISMLIPTSFKK